ncbi:hypothetical protein V2I01_33975 [Micromonospora sp. BRA006-A]|nr:hypothetical protein [Micromonospora sp. BRA006-A]
MRFVVTVPEQPPVSIGGASNSAGEAARCYRYEFELYRYDVPRDRLSSGPAHLAAHRRAGAGVPETGGSGSRRLRTATPETLAGAGARPSRRTGSPSTRRCTSALVAAVGVPAEQDCLLLVRYAGREDRIPGYDRI